MTPKTSTKSSSARVKKVKRCSWCAGDPVLEEYHDNEWGVPETDDNRLFERMSLQIFQAGLNWKMILGKRKALGLAFGGFRIEKVARFDARSLKRLLADESIIRNRLKIAAVIENAKRVRQIQNEHGSFRTYLETLPGRLVPLQEEFRKKFKFMGPEITRMFVMNIGKVRTVHESGCFRRGQYKPW